MDYLYDETLKSDLWNKVVYSIGDHTISIRLFSIIIYIRPRLSGGLIKHYKDKVSPGSIWVPVIFFCSFL